MQTEELYLKAKETVIKEQTVSTEFLRAKLNIGFMLAAIFIDRLEKEGIIGPGKKKGRLNVITTNAKT